MDKIFLIAEGQTSTATSEEANVATEKETGEAKSQTNGKTGDSSHAVAQKPNTQPATMAEVRTIVDQQLAPFGDNTGVALGVLIGVATLAVLLSIILFYVQSVTSQRLARLRERLDREVRERDKEIKNLREAIERLGGMVTENRDAIAEASRRPVEPQVVERPPQPAPPRENPLDVRYKAFVTDYNALLTVAGQGMAERTRRDELIAKYTGLVGIECANAAERMNNMKLEPIFCESENLIKANYWLLPLDSYGYALVPSVRLLGDTSGSSTTALDRFYDTLGRGASYKVGEAALVDGVASLNVKRKGTLERS